MEGGMDWETGRSERGSGSVRESDRRVRDWGGGGQSERAERSRERETKVGQRNMEREG